jgi:hypothetical protein
VQVGFAVTCPVLHDKVPNDSGVKTTHTNPTGALTGDASLNATGASQVGVAMLRLAWLAQVLDMQELARKNLMVGDSFRVGGKARMRGGKLVGLVGAEEMCVNHVHAAA